MPAMLIQLLLVALMFLSGWWLARVGLKAKLGNGDEWLLRKRVLVVGWLVFVLLQGYRLTVDFVPGFDIPLHYCDVALPVGLLAIATGVRWLRATLLFWTFGLSWNAWITPAVAFDLTTVDFWVFWVLHGAVVVLALYDLVVLGYRPRWLDLWMGVGATIAWGVLTLGINLVSGWNYGYVGPDTELDLAATNALDVFGDWPLRLVWMSLTMVVVYALVLGGVTLWARCMTDNKESRLKAISKDKPA
ncbi:TIGR02206 family membrane protein [Mucisphaera sp.]|uniref:TMEM164-related integral membrane acyltransferase n=1 Tax=Mucisphaera sp. TaxID=2913024 RepID=UPI003D0AAA40